MILSFTTDDEADNWAISRLRSRGFAILRPHAGEWVRNGDLARMCGLSASTLCQRLEHPNCPRFSCKLSGGDRGRRTWFLPNPELLAWLKRPLQPGRRLANEESRKTGTEGAGETDRLIPC